MTATDWACTLFLAACIFVMWMLFDKPRNDRCMNTITKTPIEHCR